MPVGTSGKKGWSGLGNAGAGGVGGGGEGGGMDSGGGAEVAGYRGWCRILLGFWCAMKSRRAGPAADVLVDWGVKDAISVRVKKMLVR